MSKLPFEKIKRKILTRKEEATHSKYGKHPRKRSVEELITYGVINVNKPSGPTSHQTSDYVQKILKIDKAGHSGTLDPKVTGVLPVATGRATRIVQALLKAGKEYVALMYLHKKIPEKTIRAELTKSVGKITQLPPLRSSVKRAERERHIYYVNVLDIQDQHVLFKIGCEAGTYIRKFIHDFGQKYGGAHMAELLRTQAGPFTIENTVTLQDLTDALWYWKHEENEKYLRHCILPVEAAVQHLPKIWIRDSAVGTLTHGADLAVPGISKVESEIRTGDAVAIMTLKDELVCLGTAEMTSKSMLGSRGSAVTTTKVFMKPDTYPKHVK